MNSIHYTAPPTDSERKEVVVTPNLTPYHSTLNELANELAYNHLANSFGDDLDQTIFTEYIFDNHPFPPDALPLDSHFFGSRTNSFAEAFGYRKEKGTAQSCRNIVVIGAGASYDSYNYIPLGKTLREVLQKHFEKDIAESSIIKKRYFEEKADVTRLIKGEYDFENCLSLLSKFYTADELRQKIQELTACRYEPSLFYEIIAHLFKHNFIDVIINFNFDELLDNALEEEVGLSNYYHILHDGDCPTMAELVEEGRLKVPIYIKPHGTTRHMTTLRFTKRHYLDISPKIKRLMESLVSGERSQAHEDNIKRVNLICIGFDLTSLEFNEIIDTRLPEHSCIYHIAHGNSGSEKKRQLLTYLPTFLKHEPKPRFIPIDIQGFQDNPIISPYAEVFCVLWRIVYGRFQPMYRPRSIGRHEILSYLFYRRSERHGHAKARSYFSLATHDKERKTHLIREYFLDRIIVELALALHRSNGVVDVIQLLSSRIGHYFTLYQQQANICKDKSQFTIYQLLGEFTHDHELDAQDEQQEFLYSRNVFRIIPFTRDELVNRLNSSALLGHFGEGAVPFCEQFKQELLSVYEQDSITASILLALFTSDRLSPIFKEKLVHDYDQPVHNGLLWQGQPKPLFKEICRLFAKSVSHNYFYIRSSHRDQINHMWEGFNKRNLLLTSLAYKYHFRHNFLNTDSWDVLLCVSETGSLIDFLPMLDETLSDNHEVLEQLWQGHKRLVIICSYETVRQQHRYAGENDDVLALIEAHTTYLAGLVKSKGWDRRAIDLLLLPYWQHNHHSILFLQRTDKGQQDSAQPFYGLPLGNAASSKRFKKGFLFHQSYYYYKKGFAKSINPLFFRKTSDEQSLKLLRRDQLKLLSLYFTYVCRSISFLTQVHPGVDTFNQLSPVFKNVTTLDEYQRYTQWTHAEFNQHLTAFLEELYKQQLLSNSKLH